MYAYFDNTARSPGFDFCHIKYWKRTAYRLVTMGKDNTQKSYLYLNVASCDDAIMGDYVITVDHR
jgi:hypothetical protein